LTKADLMRKGVSQSNQILTVANHRED